MKKPKPAENKRNTSKAGCFDVRVLNILVHSSTIEKTDSRVSVKYSLRASMRFSNGSAKKKHTHVIKKCCVGQFRAKVRDEPKWNPWQKKLIYSSMRIRSSRSSSDGTRMMRGPQNIDHDAMWNGEGYVLTGRRCSKTSSGSWFATRD